MRKIIVILACCTIVLLLGFAGYRGYELWKQNHWLALAKGFAAKGGWGPGTRGEYLVRQFAIMTADSGHVGVALAAEAHDGVFKTGVDVVNKLADWLVDHLAELTQD